MSSVAAQAPWLPVRRQTIAPIPTRLAYEARTLSQYRVLSALYEFGAGHDWIAAPPSHVALFLGRMSARTAGVALRELVEHGHIERAGKRHIYRAAAPRLREAAMGEGEAAA